VLFLIYASKKNNQSNKYFIFKTFSPQEIDVTSAGDWRHPHLQAVLCQYYNSVKLLACGWTSIV
jgi:hypothetical protein